MEEKTHGKKIDIKKLKSPVLDDLNGHLKKIQSIVNHLASNEDAIEQKNCYICGERERATIADIYGFTYVECVSCKHVYTTRRYTDEAILRFYEKNEYWAQVTYANKETCEYRKENVALPKVIFAEKYLGESNGMWLDIGSGIGDLVKVAQERGWNAKGLELSETSVDFAKELFDIKLNRNTLEEFAAENREIEGQVKVVSMIGLLEHVVDPIGVLNQVKGILSQDGGVIIQVPNANSLATMVQEVFPENVFRHMSPIEHIMVFTEPSLRRALDICGFEPIAFWYHGLDVYELINNIVMTNKSVIGSRLYDQLMSNLNELQLVIDRNETSDRIICVAKLK